MCLSHCSLFLSVLFSELSNSDDNEEPGEAMDDDFDDLNVDPQPELELEKTDSGRLLSNWGYTIKS